MIALISQLHWNNLGTALQAYALHKKLLDLGYDNEYIDYTIPRSESRIIASAIKQSFLSLLRALKLADLNTNHWETRMFKGTAKRTEDFRLREIRRKIFIPSTLNSANNVYDKFIVGSDQMWFPDAILRGGDPMRLLDFVTDYRKKYSYAPSFGTTHLSIEFLEAFVPRVNEFNLISCRERSNSELLAKKLKREVEFVLDPTMLLTAEQWRKVSRRDNNHPIGKYILCYILGTKPCVSAYAEMLGSKTGLPVHYILTHPYYASKKNCIMDVGPQEFISLIDNCECLVTDSFHGIMLSVKLQKPFYVFTKLSDNEVNNDNDRISEVLNEFCLTDRFCKDDIKPTKLERIDYGVVSPKVDDLIRISENHLKKIVHN